DGLFYKGVSLIAVSRILTWLSLNVLETNEWSARLPAALAGIAAIPLFYFPTRRIFGPWTALLAILLLALSPWHLYWSQNARFYTVLLLFYTLALLTFYIGIEEDRPSYLLLSLLFLGLAMMERLSALLLMPVIVAYLLVIVLLPGEKPAGLRLRNLVILFAPGLIGGLVLALPYLRDPARWWSTMGWINNSPFWIFAGVVFYIGIPTICIGGISGLYFLARKERAPLLMILGAVVPWLAVMVISLFQYTANRYVFVALPCWLILAALGAKELFQHTEKSARLLTTGALAILLLAPLTEDLLYFKYQNGNRDDWKSAFAYIKQQKAPDDLVFVPIRAVGEYYLQEKVTKLETVDITRLPATEQKIWFVEDTDVATKWPQVLAWFRANATQVAQMDVHVQARNYRMRVYLYDPDRQGPPRNLVNPGINKPIAILPYTLE
ncbi:MAG: glycosyltransferase family 39 protein, partial [Caldilineaceae bacterium]|nr:glycosyltransferase family 39 protein [Caldilineaceae bacterium]